MEKTIRDIKTCITKSGDKLDGRMTELFNHQSTHVPQETLTEIKTQWKIITILTGVICTLIGVAGTFVLAMVLYG